MKTNQTKSTGPSMFSVGCWLLTLLVASDDSALAIVRYVDVNSTNSISPYISWTTAATNIQDAVDAAVAGDEIVVTNGTYFVGARSTVDQPTTTNRVVVDKPLELRSVNGPHSTIINGGGLFRCVYLTNDASLSGFTLFNGAAIRGAAAGGGAYGGTLNNCVLSQNTARGTSPLGQRYGAGGGAAYCTLNNCTLTGNWVSASDIGSTGGGAYYCTLNNCVLIGNSADDGGGAKSSTLSNCTLTGNSARWGSGGASGGRLNNCIIYFNTSTNGANYDSLSTLNYSCTTPLPTNGVGNSTNDPAFVNPAAGNYRLRPDSPCIDAGTNLSGIANDLDGRSRPLDGNGDGLAAFDMGAYEYRMPLLVWQDSPVPIPPHTDWATAAHTIQDAVDAAMAGDEIVVTNGIYTAGGRATVGDSTPNRVVVDKPLSLRSINGSQFTIIDGGQTARCVYLANSASLSGFTLTNGFVLGDGAGVFCESQSAIVTNCVVAGNGMGRSGDSHGGGAFGGTLNNCTLSANSLVLFRGSGGLGGGAYGSTLNNCTLNSNSATAGGGASACTLNNCALTGNLAPYAGGGASECTLNNCTLTGNSAGNGNNGWGGGASGCALNNCTLTGNSVFGYNGSYGAGASECSLNNCALTDNSAYVGDNSYGGGASGCTLNNCTLTGNQAKHGGGASGGTLNNCIVYFNAALYGANYNSYTLNYCCTTPLPTNGVGHITNAPLFVDLASGNLQLQSNSPCINAGLNAFAPAGLDLDGYPRIKGDTVDVGAYEFQLPASIISYAWLQQYALPIDGSADTVDLDGDGLNNWQEWGCGTDPTNTLSALRLLVPAVAGSDLLVRWESVVGRIYFLERRTATSSAFTPLATGITGKPDTTTYVDTNAFGAGSWFYRVGVGDP